MSAPPPIIKLEGLRKTYRMGDYDVHALRGVDLSIAPGEFVAIMGPSGSGKSTLMHVMGLLDRPDEGRVLLDGTAVATENETTTAFLRNRFFGFVFQQFNLLARTSALDNVKLPLLYAPSPVEPDRPARILEQLGLGGRSRHTPGKLSGGQQQRVAIARALAMQPQVILADEPTGNLDSASAGEIMEVLRALNQAGMTIILVTHESDIAAYAGRIIHMRDGQIQSDEQRQPPPAAHSTALPRADGPAQDGWTFSLPRMWSYFRFAVVALATHKVRALLSTLGILIGVGAFIAMMALGQGARDAIAKQFSHLGSNMLILRPGWRAHGGITGKAGESSRLTMADAEAIRREVPHVHRISSSISDGGQVVFGNKNWQTEINATTPDLQHIRSLVPPVGRFVTDEDVQTRARVAVLGPTVARELFGPQDPLGEHIKIRKVIFQVVGILPAKGSSPWRDRDDTIVIPLTTGMHRLFGRDYLGSIEIEVDAPEHVEATQEAVLALIKKRHDLAPSEQDAFSVQNMSEMLSALTETSRTMSYLLSSIAAISLIVGGIGIMNIMLVSVTERTREIGLRIAVGARRRDILGQFLVEAITISVVGGLIGILLGWAITLVLTHLAGWTAIVSSRAVLLAFVFSSAVGLVFGLWPARRASRLNPIDALRYE